MNEFTASNGIRVTLTDDEHLILTDVTGAYPDTIGLEEDVEALREFFRAEEDERLGRWRWPENPELVVYLDENGSITVFNEQTGRSNGLISREEATRFPNAPWAAVATAYFDAHPEPKPWHDAKPGEIWELGIGDGYRENSATVIDTEEGLRFVWNVGGKNGLHNIPITYYDIDYGTKVFPA